MYCTQPWIVVSGAAEASEIFHKRGQQTSGAHPIAWSWLFATASSQA